MALLGNYNVFLKCPVTFVGGAFTTIYTGAATSEVRVIEEIKESTGKPFLEAREYIFKIETTGNGEIYELKYGYEVLNTLI